VPPQFIRQGDVLLIEGNLDEGSALADAGSWIE
jgi:hypothetical protein